MRVTLIPRLQTVPPGLATIRRTGRRLVSLRMSTLGRCMVLPWSEQVAGVRQRLILDAVLGINCSQTVSSILCARTGTASLIIVVLVQTAGSR